MKLLQLQFLQKLGQLSLQNCPMNHLQVQRFLHQVTTKEIALTGLNLFSVRRTLLLTVRFNKGSYMLCLKSYNFFLLLTHTF